MSREHAGERDREAVASPEGMPLAADEAEAEESRSRVSPRPHK